MQVESRLSLTGKQYIMEINFISCFIFERKVHRLSDLGGRGGFFFWNLNFIPRQKMPRSNNYTNY